MTHSQFSHRSIAMMTTLTADRKPELGLKLTVCLCHGLDPLCCAQSLPPPHSCCHLLDHSPGLAGLWCHLIQLLCLQLNCLSWYLEPAGVSSSSTNKHKLALMKRCTEAGNVYEKHKSEQQVMFTRNIKVNNVSRGSSDFSAGEFCQYHSHDQTGMKQSNAD